MSKTLTKILTICGLCVVVIAAVVASAICATAAIGCYVSVDVIENMNLNFNSPIGKTKIKINGEETNKLLVKKGSEATITFETTDFEFKGYYIGSEGNYTEEDLVKNQEGSIVSEYKFVVDEETNLTAVFDASVFYKVNLGSRVDVVAGNGSSISLGIKGADVYKVENKNEYWVKKGGVIALDHSSIGYSLNKWFVGDYADQVSTITTGLKIEENKEYTADFNAVKYNISYDGAAAVEDVVWGSALKSVDSTYDASTGWVAFAGWKYNNQKVEKAIFGNDKDISLTSSYTKQSDKSYTLNLGKGEITYKTVADNRLDLTNAQSKNYYTLAGINFTIGEANFVFDISGNNLVQVEGGKTLQDLDTALINENITTIVATPVYELNFNIKFNVTVGETRYEDGSFVISQGSAEDIESMGVLDYFETAGGNIKNATYIQCEDSEGGIFVFDSDLDSVTIAEILGELCVSADNVSDVTFEIVFII